MSMQKLRTFGGTTFALLLVGSFLISSVMPGAKHVPLVLEQNQDHQEMVADHGHSHGFIEDLLWAIHGHSHDAVDHDHSPAMPVFVNSALFPENRDVWQSGVSKNKTSYAFLIERPPRV